MDHSDFRQQGMEIILMFSRMRKEANASAAQN
jgi:hypothetical protein